MQSVNLSVSREAVQKALPAWGITPDQLKLISLSENTVFKVDAGETSHALRVHRPGYHDVDVLNSEAEWVIALHEAGIPVATNKPTLAGDKLAKVSVLGGAETRYVSLTSWVDGTPLQKLFEERSGLALKEHYCKRLGILLAQMHLQSESWTPRAGFKRHAFDVDGFVGEAPFWGRFWEIDEANSEQRIALAHQRSVMGEWLSSLSRTPENYGLIHGDMNLRNALVVGNELYVIDFDDSGFGWFMYDVAVALYAVHQSQGFESILSAFVDGYRKVRALPDDELAKIPMFLRMRTLALLGWLHDRPEVELYRKLPGYIALGCGETHSADFKDQNKSPLPA